MPKVEMVSVGTYLARRLMQVGVGHYFTVPGDFTLSLLDEFLKEDNLNMIGCCNELNAAYAADGYARATGTPPPPLGLRPSAFAPHLPSSVPSGGMGVVCTTYMVGGLSAINGVAGAYSDDLPVLLVSGGPNYLDANERHIIHHTIGEHDLYQQSRCYEPIVTKTCVIKHLSDCSRMIDDAIRTALQRKKPVYLEIPVNLANARIPAPMPWSDVQDLPKPSSDPVTLSAAKEAVLHALTAAVKPVLLAGSKLRKSDAIAEFQSLSEALNCAVAVMPDAKGLFPEDHPNYIGRYWGSVSTPHVAEVVESCDLIVLAGPVLNDYTTTGWSALLSPSKMIILGPNSVSVGGVEYPNVCLADILRELAPQVEVKGGSLATYQRYAGNADAEVLPVTEASSALTLRNVKDSIQATLTSNSTVNPYSAPSSSNHLPR